MNKKSLLTILLQTLFLIVFNVVFFAVGGLQHSASVWIAYGFIHFAYLMVIATPSLTAKSSQSAIFGLTLYGVSVTYFFAEFIVGLFFILVGGNSYKGSLVLQIIIAGIYAAILLVNLIANEHTAESIAKHEKEVFYIKETTSQLKALMCQASDKKVCKEIEKAYDALHASPAKSSAAVEETEKQIVRLISALEEAIKCNDADQSITIAQEIVFQTSNRNRKLKIYK